MNSQNIEVIKQLVDENFEAINVLNDDLIAIYARVSLDRQSESLEHQVDLLREVARSRNLGICPEEYIYVDEGVSATKYSIWTRPAMKELLKAAKEGKFKIILFKGISRFARSTQEALDVLDRLKAQGLRVISYEENYDSAKENSSFMFTMHAAIAEYEAEKIGIRVRLGNKAKAQQGKWSGSPPDGYKLLERKLVVDPVRRPIIEKIFYLYKDGIGSFKIAETLNKLGWLTSRGKLWSSKTVRDVLTNDVYIGRIVYNRTRQKRVRDYESPEEGKKKWVRNENQQEDWVVVDNAHEAIIPIEVFIQVQNILNNRRFKKDAPNVYHPLTGILKCGSCGQGMVCQKRSTSTKEYRYYICKTYHKYGREYCKQANVEAEKLESFIAESLENRLRELYPKLNIESKVAQKDLNTLRLEKEFTEINKKLDKVNQDTANLYFERDNMTREQYDFVAKRLKDDATRLTSLRKEIERELNYREENKQIRNEVIQYIEEFFQLDKRDTRQLRQMFHYFIEKVVLDKGNIEIFYRFAQLE